MFEINDNVVYGAHGICQITSITERQFDGKKVLYYMLTPVYDNNPTTIYVPVQNDSLTSQMRKVLSADEITQLIHSMPEEKTIWIEDENQRRDCYKKILHSGNREDLLRLIKTLYLHEQHQKSHGKRLHITDEHFFKEAEKMLYDEFAHVLHLQRDQVLPYIFEQISSK
jgi:CarD family transcriptional regulator